MRRMTVATNAVASAFQIASLVLVGAAALLVLAHGMAQGGAGQQVASILIQAP